MDIHRLEKKEQIEHKQDFTWSWAMRQLLRNTLKMSHNNNLLRVIIDYSRILEVMCA